MAAANVLVTGGTGVLGREVVSRLVSEGTTVRVLSRNPDGRVPAGAEGMRGDLTTGTGLDHALAGVGTVVHCASDTRRPQRDLEATRRLLTAARAAGGPHIVYISIVGVDRVVFGYYHVKLACETYVLESGLPCTVVRATQFHDLILMGLGMLAKSPILAVPNGLRVQPVDTEAVAGELASMAVGEPLGRAPDLGGPVVEDARDMLGAYLRATGRDRRILTMPASGKAVAGIRAGGLLLENGRTVGRTFGDFLSARTAADGTVEQSYSARSYVR